MDESTSEVIDLLQRLIRNRCVSEGLPSTGTESVNADLLRSHVGSSGLDVEWFEPAPGRASLVVRIEGTDPTAPSLALMGHTDVVPVDERGWQRDPFGGELVDGEVWGRGALDMLNQTAAMAVAVRRLAQSGWRPKGTFVYLAVADEECGSQQGALALLAARPELMTDYALTEVGGAASPGRVGTNVEVAVGEKGGCGTYITVRGKPGHGSRPWGSDNAIVKAAEIVRRIAALSPAARISETWRTWVDAQPFDEELRAALVDPDRVGDHLHRLDPTVATGAHACTHRTYSVNIARAGIKSNIIPDEALLVVDIRLPPGDSREAAKRDMAELLADFGDDVSFDVPLGGEPSLSPTDTPLWDVLASAARRAYPDATLVPTLITGGTDGRHWRRAGKVAYGFGVLSKRLDPATYWSRFHNHDERVDVDSLALSVDTWTHVCRTFLG